MEGLLDFVLRDVLTRVGGSDRCVSEFIRVTGRLIPDHVFYRYIPELHNGCRTLSGVPVRPQLLGSDPESLAENAARLAQLGPFGVDLNFGCPAKVVNRHGGGASLLREPDRIGRVVEAVRRAVPADMIVSTKMRLGYDDDSLAIDCAQAMAGGGSCELVVHARTKADGYRPPAYWERIPAIRDAVNIPVIANGEIWTVDDALRCRRESGCDDIMLGRGIVADPGLAKLLGVLSLQSLPRRLALDFRDVFSEGFSFDFVRGDVTIQQGIAATNNLQMKGVNAAVLMEGTADIAKETQDLKVVVVPEINAGTASLAATVINPVVGLGSFLAQMILRNPLIRAATQEFHIDGTWADPRVTPVPRKPAGQ